MNEQFRTSAASEAGMSSYGEHGLLVPERAELRRHSISNEGRVFAPRIPLEPLWRRQIERLVALGFHEELGLSAESYAKRFPYFSQSSTCADIPAIIETQIPVSVQLSKIGLRKQEHSPKVFDIVDVPTHPYSAWFGTEYYPGAQSLVSVQSVQDKISREKQMATLLELTSVYIHYPHIRDRFPKTESHSNLFALGSRELQTTRLFALHDANYLVVFSPTRGINAEYQGAILTRDKKIRIAGANYE